MASRRVAAAQPRPEVVAAPMILHSPACNGRIDSMTARIRLAICLLPAITACGDSTGPAVAIVTHEVVDAGPLVKRLNVTVSQASAVQVVYGPDDDRLMVESAGASTDHALLLTRLRAGRHYEYEVRAGADIATGEFDTDVLPADLEAVEFVATGAPTQPLARLEFAQLGGSGAWSGVAIVDAGGHVVWYFRAPSAITGTTRRENGNFVFLDSERGLLEVTTAGDIVATLPQDPDRILHHDVIVAPGDLLWALRNDRRMVNDTVVAGEAIWEWDPEAGTAMMRWSSFNGLDPVADRGSTYSAADWLHANSLHVGPRGNVVVSLHHLDQVISIGPEFGPLEWRLGGTNATIPVTGADRFSGQHTAAEIAPGRVIVFDNGFQRSEPYSRGLEIELSANSAHSVWQFRPQRDNWSRAVGSTRRLSNGNTLVTFGMSGGLGGSTGPVEVYESGPDGSAVWHLEVGGNIQVLYRATPMASIAGETSAH